MAKRSKTKGLEVDSSKVRVIRGDIPSLVLDILRQCEAALVQVHSTNLWQQRMVQMQLSRMLDSHIVEQALKKVQSYLASYDSSRKPDSGGDNG